MTFTKVIFNSVESHRLSPAQLAKNGGPRNSAEFGIREAIGYTIAPPARKHYARSRNLGLFLHIQHDRPDPRRGVRVSRGRRALPDSGNQFAYRELRGGARGQ